jgi:cytochrome c556
MLLRGMLISVAIGLSAVAAIAQTDPILARQDLMKQNNDNARAVVMMMRGRVPYDPAKVEQAFAQWTDTAQKLPGLFPENSKTGHDTNALPAIWQNKSDFDAQAAAFGKAVAENRAKAIASLDGLKAAIGVVGAACDNCHKDYRAPD